MGSPTKLAHIVLSTGRLDVMADWYVQLLDGRRVFSNENLVFITYDEEHHRVAFTNFGASERPTPAHTGLHHVAFTFGTLGELLENHERLKERGVTPSFSINHGPTMSMYYEDPDGNHVELQIDNYDSAEGAQAYFDSPDFARNPIGVPFDPDDLRVRHLAGEPFRELIRMPENHQPPAGLIGNQ